jgi:hypothetical protein
MIYKMNFSPRCSLLVRHAADLPCIRNNGENGLRISTIKGEELKYF